MQNAKWVNDGECSDGDGTLLLLILQNISVVIATAAAVFERILQNAVDIKSENDLTV